MLLLLLLLLLLLPLRPLPLPLLPLCWLPVLEATPRPCSVDARSAMPIVRTTAGDVVRCRACIAVGPLLDSTRDIVYTAGTGAGLHFARSARMRGWAL